MRRLLKLLAKLYPTAWRNRYATEFEAMLEDTTPRARDVFDIFLGAVKMQLSTWSFIRIMLASSFAGVLAAISISFAFPAHYVSQSLIAVSAHDAMPTNDPDNPVRRHLMDLSPDFLGHDSLARIIQQQNLYPRERASMPLDAVIDKMRRSIAIEPVETGNVSPAVLERSGIPIRPLPKGIIQGLVILFDYPDPSVAQKVNRELVSQFIAASLKLSIDSASASRPQPRLEFRLHADPSLPQEPKFPKRSLFGITGLLAGLVAGLMLAAIVRFRHNPPATNN